MSAEINAKNSNKSMPAKNDWEQDDEDDNWDDWGDAEDNFDDAQAANFPQPKSKNETLSPTNNNISTRASESVEKVEPIKQDINSNSGVSTGPIRQQTSNTTVSQKSTAGWGGLFGGVVSSVFSTASEGLGNITSTVSQGLNQVIGVPDPEELARMQAVEVANKKDDSESNQIVYNTSKQQVISSRQTQNVQQDEASPAFGLSIVSGVTTLGTKVLNTGLDTLEGIGKKTMHILQENDPLLMNKRKMLGLETERPNLSQVLKEAKKDADQLESTLKELKLEKSREMLRFDLLFENHCGLVHLEALEILSQESTFKLQKLQDAVSGNALTDLQETITEVKELMELEDLEGESDGNYDAKELNFRLMATLEDVELQINFDDITNNWAKALDWLNVTAADAPQDPVQETFAKGITMLAETCALQMCKLHKIAELLLVKDHHSTANEVDCIVQLCKQFNAHLNGLTNRFATALTAFKLDSQPVQEDVLKSHVSTLFAEMLVATQHIEKAFNLFLPILQMGAV
ncbi:PREDICTED: protein FAM114A2 isoform X1 [Rhagoletis zephyria]|uniref:protein FAM114A2 isoform X1 n=1 Tax=Rhagoletis zephyria TaxID=28612 RepID=UPI0008112C24|nr:PREDICTED: protein FAM114A2 isoform X1 [Rhagoletis zephyria]